jgi:hypothetical protein
MEKTMMELLGQMSVLDIETMIKDQVKPYLKDRKETEKLAAIKSVKEQIHEGDTVTVRFKDGEITGIVAATREKTFSILTEDILNSKGEPSRISRGYDFVTSIEESGFEEETAEEEVAEVAEVAEEEVAV